MLPEKKNIKIFLAGDSTISIKEPRYYPETGWGMPFVYFWDSTVTVVNKAKNGRSTSSFRHEGSWKQIMDECSEGDYVFIQFGHNDEVATKKTYTTETEFKANLVRYVQEAREKKPPRSCSRRWPVENLMPPVSLKVLMMFIRRSSGM